MGHKVVGKQKLQEKYKRAQHQRQLDGTAAQFVINLLGKNESTQK